MRNRVIAGSVLLVSLVASLAPSPARAGVSLGASFGYTHASYSFEGVPEISSDVLGVPGSQEWKQPGLRLGYLAPSGRWDVNVDLGAFHRSTTYFPDDTVVELLPQIQANARWKGCSPFVNAGIGFLYERPSAFDGTSATRPVFGAGIGIRKAVSEGHGLLRAEVRYDHVPEHAEVVRPGATDVFLATNMVSVKLGFDLVLGPSVKP